MVFGSFDPLHEGHLNFFEQAKKYGDELIAVVARDETIEQVKKHKSRHNEEERLEVVKEHVDKAVLGNPGNKYDIIKENKPDVICLGYDQTSFVEGLEAYLKGYNIKIVRLKAYKPDVYKSSRMKSTLSS